MPLLVKVPLALTAIVPLLVMIPVLLLVSVALAWMFKLLLLLLKVMLPELLKVAPVLIVKLQVLGVESVPELVKLPAVPAVRLIKDPALITTLELPS